MPLISFSQVTAGYATAPVLNNFNLTIDKGSLAVLFGGSGSGKSTVFRVLNGEVSPTGGKVVVGETTVGELSKKRLAEHRQSLGIISSDVTLLEDRTIEENLVLPLEMEGISKARRSSRLEDVLARFELAGVRDSYPSTLSMSERQRAAIARAVIKEPLVLLVDEPTAHLDAPASQEIARLLAHENVRGMTILIGTSDERFLAQLPQAQIVRL